MKIYLKIYLILNIDELTYKSTFVYDKKIYQKTN